MSNLLPSAKSVAARTAEEAERIRSEVRRTVRDRGLAGLANDTKWDELLAAMRFSSEGQKPWRYSWRSEWISGHISDWDCEWFYHLPFPMAGVEWLDIAFLQEVVEHRLPPRVHVIDHSPWLMETLARIGLDYRRGQQMVRIYGYAPRDLERFDVVDSPA